jgi:protein-disulfide isomerase
MATQEMGAPPSRLVDDYAKAPIVMLSSDAYGGATAKGGSGGQPEMEIAELADFQCPGCKMAAQTLKPFLSKHGDKVRLTFHNFPLDGSCNPYAPHGMHAIACALARGGLCAAKQDKFWPYHDQVYDRQNEGMGLSTIDDVAATIGLDTAAFQACMKDPQTEMQLQKDMQLGEMVNLESTPTLVINGHKLTGARPPAEYEALLYQIEKEKK